MCAKKKTDNIQLAESDCPQANEITITNRIKMIRGCQVMLDRDLAELYGVETRALNQAVKRNIERFPNDFMFQLSKEESSELESMHVCNVQSLKSQSVTSEIDDTQINEDLKSQTVTSSWGGPRKLPYAFTENGIAMLSSVLRSPTAIEVNIRIMRAFTAMRQFLSANAQVFQRLETIEYHQLEMAKRQDVTDRRLDEVFQRLDDGAVTPQQGIFYDGQIFDAYTFVASLIKSAKREIVLIDNYVDETVLTLLDKRSNGVEATIYTAQISRQLQLDITRHNSQFPPIAVNSYRQSHDRFLCIDDEVYHIGASIKDLGKKWFAFAKMLDIKPIDLTNRINGIDPQ